MWRTDTPWFIAALIMSIFAVGGVLFGRFEQHKSHGQRIGKQVAVLATFVLVDVFAGRSWSCALLALAGVAVVAVHGWWLPRHGINGLTAEPYDRYLELVTRNRRGGGS